MRRALARIAMCTFVALVPALSGSSQEDASPKAQTSGTFRWVDFHSPQDQNIVAWITRSFQVAQWTAIREIGVEYDAALVVTVDRTNPQSAPGSDSFTLWSASLTSHVVAPLLTGVNLRWFDLVRFADDAREEWPVLYDNCHDCQPNTYFTAFYYDVRSHTWAARWVTGGHGIAVWNTNHSGIEWTQVFAVLSGGEGHVALYTWNHFEYPKPRPAEDYISRYDLDPFSHLERTVAFTQPTPPTASMAKQLGEIELDLCRAETAAPGLARGQDSHLCQQLLEEHVPRQPVTTPPANNRGQAAPPRAKRKSAAAPVPQSANPPSTNH